MSIDVPSEKFRPRPWIPGGHAQTLWRKFAPVTQVMHTRERIELSDGDFLDVDWHEPPGQHSGNNGTIVLILHGLCGCSRSSYVQSLQSRLGIAGYPSVAMNFRGCSGQINRLAKAYHSGITEDLAEVFAYIRQRYSDYQIAVTGFSLGANVLLKWLGETGSSDTAVKAIAVSTPFQLSHCSQAMRKGLSHYYGKYFLRRLVNDLEIKKKHFRETANTSQLEILESFGDLRDLNTLWDFDDKVTAPLHGFSDAQDYYDKCSSINFLAHIKTPTLLIQSYDDPIIPPHALPGKEEISEHLLFDISQSGGHVGFASVSDPYWLEHRIIKFISQ